MNTSLDDQVDPSDLADSGNGVRHAVEPGVSSPSQVGTGVRIEGEIFSQQDLFLDGDVKGNVLLPNHKLSIGPQAKVKASIKAKNVVLVGSVEGTIEATERIELRGRCSLLGDVRSPRIMIENGAYIKGRIEVTR